MPITSSWQILTYLSWLTSATPIRLEVDDVFIFWGTFCWWGFFFCAQTNSCVGHQPPRPLMQIDLPAKKDLYLLYFFDKFSGLEFRPRCRRWNPTSLPCHHHDHYSSTMADATSTRHPPPQPVSTDDVTSIPTNVSEPSTGVNTYTSELGKRQIQLAKSIRFAIFSCN